MAKDFHLKPLEDRIVVKSERGGGDDGLRHRDPRHRQGEAPGGLGRGGRPRPVRGRRTGPARRRRRRHGHLPKYGGTEVKVEGEEYLILSARDVLAIATKAASKK